MLRLLLFDCSAERARGETSDGAEAVECAYLCKSRRRRPNRASSRFGTDPPKFLARLATSLIESLKLERIISEIAADYN